MAESDSTEYQLVTAAAKKRQTDFVLDQRTALVAITNANQAKGPY